MLRSMFSAISGMRANQVKMDVTGNNIANVNTVGFKGSQVVFQDTLSQMMRNGAAPGQGLGGTNPAQVGLGVQVAGISTNFTQGAAQGTGRATDFMINGDGFFVTRSGGEQLYTRAGSMSFDGAGNLVTASGQILQGWPAVNGVVNPNGGVRDLRIPFGQIMDPIATTSGSVSGNLPTNAAVGTSVETAITMFDGQGRQQDITYGFTKDAANSWTMNVSDANGNLLGSTGLTFDDTGKMTTPANNEMTFNPGMPGWPGPVTLDLTRVSQFGGQNTISATEQDGASVGSLQSFSLGEDGIITGLYSNGRRDSLGMVAMASFANPNGLEKAGNSMYRVGNNSGIAQVGTAGTNGRGLLASGALEMSNVDLAEEFTSLIVAQRGFQANSRVITASDEILQDVVNLKR
jgi:flagellar hook protein FlgE